MSEPTRDATRAQTGEAETRLSPGDTPQATLAQSADEIRLPIDEPQPAGPPAPPGYEILGLLGRGGMGVVYKARQTELNRVVALKMILGGGYATDIDLVRFEAEEAAIAAVRHPNVVQVFHAGRLNGLPFFAMEYVAGGTLGAKLENGPLAPREAARLLEQVALGVDACHAAGILHRDLKPGNILLSGDADDTRSVPPRTETGRSGTVRAPVAAGPVPKVTDFGLAKRYADKDGPTVSGTVMGTPSYMAPEQVRGEVRKFGPVTDVYGLGSVFYCALTGRPPFQAPTWEETLRQVTDADPPPVRVLQPGVPRDLETICLKCLEKDPARRYPTAEAMADDLRRWLDGRPILARRAGPAERAWKWVKRNRTVSAATAAVVAALAAGTGVSLWQADVARREAANARTAEAEARKAEAETADRERAEAAARETAEAVTQFMQDVFRQAGSMAQAAGGRRVDPNLTVKDAMNQAAKAVGARFRDRPAVEAAVRQTIGQTYIELAAYPEAERQLTEALAIRRRTLGDRHRATLDALSDLGRVYREMADYDRAERYYAEALAGRRETLGDRHPETLATALSLASLYRAWGRLGQAEPLLQEALAGDRALHGDRHPATFQALGNLASLHAARGEYDRAEALYEEALAGRRETLPPRHPNTVATIFDLGFMYYQQGRYADAEPLLREALDARRAVLTADHPHTLACVNTLALLYFDRGEYGRAEPLFREVLAAFSARPDGALVAHLTRGHLGLTLLAERRYADAEQHLLAAYRWLKPRRLSEINLIRLRRVARGIVELYEAWGKPAEAADWRAKLGDDLREFAPRPRPVRAVPG